MRRESIDALIKQVFRRIGYTVGLWDILRISEICAAIAVRGNLDRGRLVADVGRAFELRQKDAEGKVDVARVLNLLISAGNRYALSANGRALLSIVKEHGVNGRATKAFFLRRVVETDGDLSLNLFNALGSGSAPESVGERFLVSLDASLSIKREAFGSKAVPMSLRSKLMEQLLIKDLRPRPSPFSRAKTAKRPYRFIEIQPESISHYLRHTVTPRRGWLTDLDLVVGKGVKAEMTADGRRLLDFIGQRGLLHSEAVILEPDSSILLETLGLKSLILTSTIDPEFFDEMTSSAYGGGPPRCQDMTAETFLKLLGQHYQNTKLQTFEQAEVAALRESVLVPMLVDGKTLKFEELLNEVIQSFPDRLHKMSSRTASGTYISFKKGAI